MSNTVRCSGCGVETVCNQQKHLPDNGWDLPFDLFGYYGGFTDEVDVLFSNRRSRSWILCHDCIVKLLTVFPLLGDTIGRGTHLCEDETPCCEWAWRSTERFGKYERNDNDELVPVAGAHYQIVVNGQWQDAQDEGGAGATGD